MKKIYILFLLLLIVGCGKKFDPYKIPEDIKIELNDNIFKVFSEHKTKELIKNKNIKITNNKQIDTNTIGKHNYTLEFKYNNKDYKYDLEYEVIDDEAPKFIYSPMYINTSLGDDIILCNIIQYADNYDSNPSCKITGDYNLNQVGTYEFDITITDSSGNENYDHSYLNVLEKMPENKKREHNYVHMKDLEKYKKDNTAIGIDVSRWQGDVDFKKIKDAGIEFVIMRMGYQKDLNDNYEKDMKFDEYYKQAKEVGLDISVYVYTNASSVEGGKKAAKWIIDNLNGDKVDLPIAFDWEDWTDFNSYHMSLHTLGETYKVFAKTLEENGYEAMLYSSKFYLENIWTNYGDTNIWLAHYIDQTTYQGDYMLWQMTDEGVIDGITENTVDIDILYKK